MNEAVFIAAIMIPATLFAVSLYWVDIVRRRECLFRWVSRNNLKLNQFRCPLVIERSAFPFSVSHSQHVFRVEVEEVDGTVRHGWVRVGSPLRGLWSPQADVQWDTATHSGSIGQPKDFGASA